MTDDGDMKEIREAMDEIRTKVYDMHAVSIRNEEHLSNINGTIEKHEERLSDTEKKTRDNERKLYMGLGAAMAVSVIVSAAVQYAAAAI